jgi:hypothetical protein
VWRRQSGWCDHSFIDEANPWQYSSDSLERDERLLPGCRDTAELTMWVCAFGAFCLAALVNQIAIALCRRAQAPPNAIVSSSVHLNCSLADDAEFDASAACTSRASGCHPGQPGLIEASANRWRFCRSGHSPVVGVTMRTASASCGGRVGVVAVVACSPALELSPPRTTLPASAFGHLNRLPSGGSRRCRSTHP